MGRMIPGAVIIGAMRLYHFTPAKNLPSIRKRGLLPFIDENDPADPAAVWFTSYGGDVRGEVRLTVQVPDDGHLEGGFGDESAEWYRYLGTIPPDQIEFP